MDDDHVEKVHAVICESRRLTAYEVSEEVASLEVCATQF
jgi:hypothetical protein